MKPNAKEWIIRVGLVFAATALSVGVAEWVARRTLPIPPMEVGTTETLKAARYGWAPIPNKRNRFFNPDTRARSYYTTNSQGWRDVEHTFEKPDGTKRIVFLGDSFTFGITTMETIYTRLVEKELKERGYPHVEVISMGVGGWGTDQELEALRNEGVRYRPDVVVYQYCKNDLGDNMLPAHPSGQSGRNWRSDEMLKKKPFRYHVNRRGHLTKVEVEDNVEVSPPHWLLRRSVLAYNIHRLFRGGESEPESEETLRGTPGIVVANHNYVRKAGNSAALASSAQAEAIDECTKERLFEALLLEMRRVAREAGAEFAVCTVGQHNYAFLRRICKKNKIHVVPARRYPYERYNNDRHITARGNHSMALDIADQLVEWNMLGAPQATVNKGKAAPIPTLTEWGLIIFMTLIMGIGVVVLYRRRTV